MVLFQGSWDLNWNWTHQPSNLRGDFKMIKKDRSRLWTDQTSDGSDHLTTLDLFTMTCLMNLRAGELVMKRFMANHG